MASLWSKADWKFNPGAPSAAVSWSDVGSPALSMPSIVMASWKSPSSSESECDMSLLWRLPPSFNSCSSLLAREHPSPW